MCAHDNTMSRIPKLNLLFCSTILGTFIANINYLPTLFHVKSIIGYCLCILMWLRFFRCFSNKVVLLPELMTQSKEKMYLIIFEIIFQTIFSYIQRISDIINIRYNDHQVSETLSASIKNIYFYFLSTLYIRAVFFSAVFFVFDSQVKGKLFSLYIICAIQQIIIFFSLSIHSLENLSKF